MNLTSLFAGIALLLALAAPAAASPPLSPEDSLKAIHLAPGLRAELVAAEPEVVDPVAIRFDERGRLWVVEMRDYPSGPHEGQAPQSRIRVLEDADGDGRYETAHTFAEGLAMPTGLQPWKGGVFVTLAGRLAYLKDTDGDGRADLDETWFTGFAEENEQLRANHPKLALDGFIYVASGLRGGVVRNARSGEERTVNLRSADFRFDPRSGEWDTAAGNSQFGLTFDDFGRRFLCENRHPLRHVVLEERYLRRNPLLAVPAVYENVAPSDAASRIWPLTRQWTTAGFHAGQFTAACGVEIYRGSALPREYYGHAFTCEPTGSLVHCERMRPHGATFRSEPMFADREFLASTDEWFRPVNLEHGPDGALYVVDMYRQVIEHPHWMPEEMKSRLDFRAGDDRGRIYRIVAEDARLDLALRSPQLAEASVAELVTALDDRNGWTRDTAFRLLLEREERECVAEIGRRFPALDPAGRAAALWVVDAYEGLDQGLVLRALNDKHPGVLEQACVLLEPVFSSPPLRQTRAATALQSRQFRQELFLRIPSSALERDPRLGFQMVLSTGGASFARDSLPHPRAAWEQGGDPWVRRGLLCVPPEQLANYLATLIGYVQGQNNPSPPGFREVVREVAQTIGRQGSPYHAQEAMKQSASLAKHPQGAAIVQALRLGLAEGLAAAKEFAAADQLAAPAAQAAEACARDANQPNDLRLQAVELLAFTPPATTVPVLAAIATDLDARELHEAAVRSLGRQRAPEAADALLELLTKTTGPVRRTALDGLLGDDARLEKLLGAIEAGDLPPGEVDRARVEPLRQHTKAAIRARVEALWPARNQEDLARVRPSYLAALAGPTDPARGRELFRQHCATCHRVSGIGTAVGPDIAELLGRTREQLLNDVLEPSQAIDGAYQAYLVITTDGRQHTGLLAAETDYTLTLKQADNQETPILRREIERIQSTGASFMPAGFEKTLDPQSMADVIAFLKEWRFLEER
ncbi:MAG: PVC-type heme-binding CxxCH protein [Pirellulales bacterium]